MMSDFRISGRDILCGRPAVDISLSEDRHSLALWGKHCIKEEKFDELIGPSLRDQISYPCLKVFTEVAYKCLDNHSNGRPTMSDVVVSLEDALISQNRNGEIVSEQNEEQGVKNNESDNYILFDTVNLNSSLQPSPITSLTTPVQDGANMMQDKKRSKGKVNKAFQWNFLGLFNKRSFDSTSVDESDTDYCSDGNNTPFVYEFQTNGSLEDYLFGTCPPQPLQWASRIKIALDTATDLFSLYYAKEQVIHRDVKPSNILLGPEFCANLSDGEIARVGPTDNSTHVSTRVMGTYGYAAPEYVATGRLTAKCDVYSFGVVMVELLTGHRAIDPTETGAKKFLVQWAKPYLKNKRKLVKIMDTKLEGQYPHNDAFAVATLALQCLKTSPTLRPQMLDILVSFEKLQATKTGTKKWFS